MPTTPRKKLIEVALPLEAINVASAREKSIRHGHPSTLHLWWARRPLAAARAVIFSSLVDDPDSPDALPAFVEACRSLPKGPNATANDTPRMRLFDFIEVLVKWESTTDEKVLKTARDLIMIATEGNPPPLLDPFAGGGSIPLEAQRLGLEAHASDLNPVAVMINKAQIEIPPRFANQPPVNPRDRQQMNSSTGWKGAAGLAADVRYYGEWIREKAWDRIGHLYPNINGRTVIAWLWARTVKCPNPACQFHTPLLSTFVLASKQGRVQYLIPQITEGSLSFEVSNTPPSGFADPKKGLKRGMSGIFECIRCGTITTRDYVSEQGKQQELGLVLTAVVAEGDRKREFYGSNEIALPTSYPDIDTSGLTTELAPNPRDIWCRNFGLNTPADLFTTRQLVALTTLSDLVIEARDQVYQDAMNASLLDDKVLLRDGGRNAQAYAEAVSVYLAFALSRSADRGSTICSWDSSPKMEALRNTFARQAIPMTWDFAEGNPFSESSGNWLFNVEWVSKAVEGLRGEIQAFAVQDDATTVDPHDKRVLSTDPPYYDNIGYADLSDFFYVWLRRTLKTVFPEIFETMLVPKNTELVASAYRFAGNREAANHHFEDGMSQAFARMRGFVDNQYPLTVYYAFKQSESDERSEDSDKNDLATQASTGWETMLNALIQAGFSVNGTWPIRTELKNRMVGMGTNALASSIVLVCRPRPENAPTISRRQFVDALRRELPDALRNLQSGNIAPVDLAQASIGPGMAIYSRYSKVLEADGSALTVRAALGLINQELDAYLAEQDGEIDADTRFAVAWFSQFAFDEGEFGAADVLARAKNTSVAGVESAGLVAASRGKVKLRHWTEYDPGAWDPQADRRPTVWEAVHHLIERLNAHGESGAAGLLLKMKPEMAAEARALAYRLYSICERKGWAEHALEYNKLVVSWTGVADQAAETRAADARGDGTKQLGLFE